MVLRQGIKLNTVFYGSLIGACEKGTEMRLTLNICDAMLRLVHDVVSYSASI